MEPAFRLRPLSLWRGRHGGWPPGGACCCCAVRGGLGSAEPGSCRCAISEKRWCEKLSWRGKRNKSRREKGMQAHLVGVDIFLKIWTSFRRSFRVSLKDVAEALKGCCWQCLGWGENCGEDLPQGG